MRDVETYMILFVACIRSYHLALEGVIDLIEVNKMLLFFRMFFCIPSDEISYEKICRN